MKKTKTDWDALCQRDERASRGCVDLLLRGLLRDSRELLEKNAELVARIRAHRGYDDDGPTQKVLWKDIKEAMNLQTVIGKLCGHTGYDAAYAAVSFGKIKRVQESDKLGMRLVRDSVRRAKQTRRRAA